VVEFLFEELDAGFLLFDLLGALLVLGLHFDDCVLFVLYFGVPLGDLLLVGFDVCPAFDLHLVHLLLRLI
jgi:hypothetical protein